MNEINNNGVISLPNALDSLKRSNYPSDEAYLEAAADLTMKRNSKEFQDAFRSVQTEYAKRKFEEMKEGTRREIEEIKRNITLSDTEMEKCRIQASQAAQVDLLSRKITNVELAGAIQKYEQQFIKTAKDEKAHREALNKLLRGSLK